MPSLRMAGYKQHLGFLIWCGENGIFFMNKNDISPYIFSNILILLNSKQTEEAGRALKSENSRLIIIVRTFLRKK